MEYFRRAEKLSHQAVRNSLSSISRLRKCQDRKIIRLSVLGFCHLPALSRTLLTAVCCFPSCYRHSYNAFDRDKYLLATSSVGLVCVSGKLIRLQTVVVAAIANYDKDQIKLEIDDDV